VCTIELLVMSLTTIVVEIEEIAADVKVIEVLTVFEMRWMITVLKETLRQQRDRSLRAVEQQTDEDAKYRVEVATGNIDGVSLLQ
jgi:hypothetical protein